MHKRKSGLTMIRLDFLVEMYRDRGHISKDIFKTGETIAVHLRVSDVQGNDFFHLKFIWNFWEFFQKARRNSISVFEHIGLKSINVIKEVQDTTCQDMFNRLTEDWWFLRRTKWRWRRWSPKCLCTSYFLNKSPSIEIKVGSLRKSTWLWM